MCVTYLWILIISIQKYLVWYMVDLGDIASHKLIQTHEIYFIDILRSLPAKSRTHHIPAAAGPSPSDSKHKNLAAVSYSIPKSTS